MLSYHRWKLLQSCVDGRVLRWCFRNVWFLRNILVGKWFSRHIKNTFTWKQCKNFRRDNSKNNHTFRDHSITAVPWKPVFFLLKDFQNLLIMLIVNIRKMSIQLCPMTQCSYFSVNESYQMMNDYWSLTSSHHLGDKKLASLKLDFSLNSRPAYISILKRIILVRTHLISV